MAHQPAPRTNLASFLDDLAKDPGRCAFALRTPYRRFAWTAAEIRTAALALVSRLRASGVAPGDAVLLQGPGAPEWVAAFFGIVASGGVVVPLEEDASPDRVRGIAERVRARAAIAPVERLESLRGRPPSAAGELGGSSRTRGAPGRDAAAWHSLEGLEALRRERAPDVTVHRAAPGDTAEIVFTSGTTAEPKGVQLTHRNLLVNLEGIERGFRKHEWYLRPFLPLRLLCLVPLSHLFGQTVGVLVPILLRSTSLFSSTLQPSRLLDVVRREGPIGVVTMPRSLAAMAEAARREIARRGRAAHFERGFARSAPRAVWRRVVATRDIRSVLGWRTWAFVSGGAALDPGVEEFWGRCGYAVIQGYGLTEAAPIITISNPFAGMRGTLGRPVGGQDVRLSEEGEILVRGPNVMSGYYRDPESTREVLDAGWLRTGDLAERDAEGRLLFRGRKKDLIVTAEGMNVFPSDVERVLETLPGVRRAVVFARPGPRGEEVAAAVLPALPAGRGTQGQGSRPIETLQEIDPERIRRDANAILLPHQRLKVVTLWREPEFPVTQTGKVRRREVAARVLARAGAGSLDVKTAGRGKTPSDPRGGGSSSPTGVAGKPGGPAGVAEEPSGPSGAAGEPSGSGGMSGGSGAGPSSRVVSALLRLGATWDGAITAASRLEEDLGLSSIERVELIGLLEEESDAAIDDRRLASSLTVGDLERLVEGGGEEPLRVNMPRWTRRAPAALMRGLLRAVLLRPWFARYVRLAVTGREHLRGAHGPLLFVANHTSLLDAPAILFAIPRRFRRRLAPAMAIETLPAHFDPRGRSLGERLRSALLYDAAVLLFSAYPFPQSRGFRPSLEYTGELLDAGFHPLVFPEGHMTTDGRMHAFKAGIGLLAIETRARIVPIRVSGLAAILPPDGRWPRRGRARVVIGEPLLPFEPLGFEAAAGPSDAGQDRTAGHPDAVAIAARIERAVGSLPGD